MSTPFTSVADAGGAGLRNIASLSFMTEIYNAIIERCTFVVTSPPFSAPQASMDFQARSWFAPGWGGWYEWQRYIAGNLASLFIPTMDDYTGQTVANYAADDSQFFEDAGISPVGASPYGFRRATAWDPATSDWTNIADPMFSYGYAQPGDILGPWIMVDLQNALSALKHTLQSVTLGTGYRRTSGTQSGTTCTNSRTAAINAWTAAPWTSAPGAKNYLLYAHRQRVASTLWTHTSTRDYREHVRPADAYFRPAGRPFVVDFYATQPSTGTPSPDFPGAGLGQRIRIAANVADGQTVDMKQNADPISLFGWTCPFTGLDVYSIEMGIAWLVKHDPTNSNL